MHLLKQSTAATVIVGPVLDSTGTAYTGMTIADFNITKNGTSTALAAAATATHDHNGHYLLALTTGNTDTLGRLAITCNKATYAMAKMHYEVLSAVTFDALVTNAFGQAASLPIIGTSTNNFKSDGSANVTYANTAPLDAAGVRTAVGLAAANLDTQLGATATAAVLSTVNGKVDTLTTNLATANANVATIQGQTTTSGVVVATASKTGYALSATGLDAIPATEPSGKPSTFVGWLMWLVQYRRRADKSASAIVVKSESGTTITTQVISDDGAGNQSLGPPT